MTPRLRKRSYIPHLTLLGVLLVGVAVPASAATGIIPALTVTQAPGGGQEYSVTLQILALMTALTFLPAFLMMMTCFTRIIVVFAILRQALGLQSTPSNQILVGISLFLTIFIMNPVFQKVNVTALQPYLNNKINMQQAVEKGSKPFRKFMMANTRNDDLQMFAKISGKKYNSPKDVSFWVLMPAFVTSELKTAFEIGFMLFIPFLIIDMVVASVLMAMGMMMLSPMIISLPFKIMLFVMVNGWTLIMGTLAASYGM